MGKLTNEEKIAIIEMKLEDSEISSRKIAKKLWGKNQRKSTINDWVGSEDYLELEYIYLYEQFKLKSSSDEIVEALNNSQIKTEAYKKRDGAYDLGRNILVISDTHYPYHHPDTFAFLRAIKDKYAITGVVHVGDATDMHTVSYHENCYGALSPSEEYKQGKICLQNLEEMFPQMLMVSGNHGALNKRKAQTAGIPLVALKDENQLYELNAGWLWGDSFMFWVGDKKCLLTHFVGASTKNNAMKFAHCSCQGHAHSEAGVSYFNDFAEQRWSMSVGCLIDDKSPVFAYNKTCIVKRPVINCGVIINGVPQVIPMDLDEDGRWTGIL